MRFAAVVPLRIARHHDRLGRIDRRCRPQIVAQSRHVGGEFLALAEQARIDRDEAMADAVALPLLCAHRIGNQARPRQARAEDVDHHRQPVTLVAGVLRRTAERGQEPAFLARFQRVGAGATLLVEHPAGRAGETLVRLVADAARRHGGRRHIEQKRLPVGCRRGERPWVGAELRLLAEGRGDLDARGAGARHADQPLLRRHQCVIAGRAEMSRVAHRGDRHAGGFRLVDRDLHRETRRHVAEPAIAVDQRRDRRLLDDARPRRHVRAPAAAQPVIAGQHRYAVAVDAVQIRPGEDVRSRFRIVLGHPPGRQDGFELRAMRLVRCGHGRLLRLSAALRNGPVPASFVMAHLL